MSKKTTEDIFTIPLESATRKEIDRILINLGWNINEFEKDCNVFTERIKTKAEEKKIKDKYPQGRFPDYVLYSSQTDEPIAVIEAKRVGVKLDKALIQAKEYALCIGAKIIFAVDGSMYEAKRVDTDTYLKQDGSIITDLLTERTLCKFIDQNTSEILTPQKATKMREDLIAVFGKTNNLLRDDGIREGVERFTEFSNILFLKLFDEIEDDREAKGEERRIEKDYCWKYFCDKPAKEMLNYINDTILSKLGNIYNHDGDVFPTFLKITPPKKH
jgi:type I restriction enzyme M protein